MTWICPECKKKEELLKINRAGDISAQIDQENKKHENKGMSISSITLAIIAFAIFAIIMFASESEAADKMVVVGATSSGMAIWEKAPDYDSLRIHYFDQVSKSMKKLRSDSLNQETVVNEITNIALQSVFANRLPETITPYNMISIFTDDPVLRTNLINLVSNTVWLRNDAAAIVLKDNRRFTLTEGEWYYVASEAEVRPVDYNELICLVMGVDYVAPKPVEHIATVGVVQVKQRNLPGYSTVEP